MKNKRERDIIGFIGGIRTVAVVLCMVVVCFVLLFPNGYHAGETKPPRDLYLEEMKNQTKAMERIATAVERANSKR